MSKKSIRIISIVLTAVIMLAMLTTNLLAYSPSSVNADKDISNINGLKKVESVGTTLASTIRTVGIIASVAILMILGIKYMMGSSEEKASYKKTMIPYLIGAVLLFGASLLTQFIYDFAQTLNS